MYEFPNVHQKIRKDEIEKVLKNWNLEGNQEKKIGTHHHIFSHIEWDMMGYKIQVNSKNEEFIWVQKQKIIDQYPIPGAFEPFRKKM